MSVQIAFYYGTQSWVHSVIQFVTRSRFSHCEIVIDGQGYTPKRGHRELFMRPRDEYAGDWVLVDTDWNRDKAFEYIDAHQRVEYDFRALVAHLLPIHDSLHAQNCSEFVVNVGAYCGEPRFHNRPAWRYAPSDVFKVVGG